jgi:hypothetical protein
MPVAVVVLRLQAHQQAVTAAVEAVHQLTTHHFQQQ